MDSLIDQCLSFLLSSSSSFLSSLPFPAHHALLGLLLLVVLYKIATADCDLVLAWTCLFHTKWRLRSYYTSKVVWITGASSGLGRALALELAPYRCKLVLSARRVEELNRVKDECVTLGANEDDIFVLPMDSLDFKKLPELVRQVVKEFGTIDVLVNNAARGQRSLAEDTPIEIDRGIMELNYFGYVALTKAVMPHMIERKRGSIVAISSFGGKMGGSVQSSYVASKHAIMGFYNSLRFEMFNYNIDVLAVCPGPVHSDFPRHSFTESLAREHGDGDTTARKQEASRYAELASVAIAGRLPETWIVIQPYLLFTYLVQYLPIFFNSRIMLGSPPAQGRITNFRNNQCIW